MLSLTSENACSIASLPESFTRETFISNAKSEIISKGNALPQCLDLKIQLVQQHVMRWLSSAELREFQVVTLSFQIVFVICFTRLS